MKTTLCNILLLCIMCVAGTACTHNHGEINGWFGTWAIDDAGTTDYDGTEVPRTFFLQFQSSVVCLRYTDALHNGGESYGSWAETTAADGTTTMEINFEGNYDVAYLPQHAVYTVSHHAGDHATLVTTLTDGTTLTLKLTRL